MTRYLFIGTIVQTSKDGKLFIDENAVILVENGKIIEINKNENLLNVSVDCVIKLRDGQFFIPGFIDCHIHAVQLPNIGIGYDKGLLDWLETYTFPLEKKYIDDKFSENVFDTLVRRTLKVGTTTACYFASLYAKSSLILAKKAIEYNQRAFIGKINMNFPRDDNYYESTEVSLKNTMEFVKEMLNINNSLVKPVITPRFALSCSMELMKGLAKIAKDFDLHIQSHVSENLSEIKVCKDLFPNCPFYTSVYDEAELLTNKTLLAHGVHLEEDELKILKERGTSVIHCPSSNTCLKSGLCDVQRLKAHGITVGLGTDVAGGQSVCMLDTMRSAIDVSNHIEMIKLNNSYKSLNYVDAFHLATLGGAKALAIDDHVGSLVVGKKFDALVIDMNVLDGPVDSNLKNYTIEEKLQRLIYTGDDRCIVQVYVEGKQVKNIN